MLSIRNSIQSTIIDLILKEARINKKAIEFPNQEAMNKYLKEHPDADKSLHKVVETKEKPSVLEKMRKKVFSETRRNTKRC